MFPKDLNGALISRCLLETYTSVKVWECGIKKFALYCLSKIRIHELGILNNVCILYNTKLLFAIIPYKYIN